MQKVALEKARIWTFDGKPGMRVCLESGLIWLTQEGDDRDILVPAQNQFVLDRFGKVILEAVENSSVNIRPLLELDSFADRSDYPSSASGGNSL